MYAKMELKKQEDGSYLTELDRPKVPERFYSIEDYILERKLGFCSCGRPEEAGKFVRDVLASIHGPVPGNEKLTPTETEYKGYDNHMRNRAQVFRAHEGAAYFTYYMLTNLGLIEHGGGVPGWLTEEGRQVLCDLIELYGPPECFS